MHKYLYAVLVESTQRMEYMRSRIPAGVISLVELA